MSTRQYTIEEVRAMTAKPAKPGGAKKRKRLSKAEYLARFMATPTTTEATEETRRAQRALFERHDTEAVSLHLPLAPSHNHYWRSWVRPGSSRVMTHVSTEGRAYQEAVLHCWRAHYRGWPPEPLSGRLRLLVSVSMARNGESDISNRIKPLEDALTAAGVWIDDSQVDDLRVLRGRVCRPGWIDLTIETIE